jgi:hypothetical protein
MTPAQAGLDERALKANTGTFSGIDAGVAKGREAGGTPRLGRLLVDTIREVSRMKARVLVYRELLLVTLSVLAEMSQHLNAARRNSSHLREQLSASRQQRQAPRPTETDGVA